MPLDPEVQAHLAAMAAADMPRIGTVSAAEFRKCQQMNRPPLASQPIDCFIADYRIATTPRVLRGRLYRPAARSSALIVYFHGGGWTLGDLESSDGSLRRLSQVTGFASLSVEYSLAPEFPFPAAVEDAIAATQWAFDHIRELVGHDVPVIVAGESAGGNLAAVVALISRDAGKPAVAAQLLICPSVAPIDAEAVRHIEAPFPPLEAISWFYDQYIPEVSRRSDPRFAPLGVADLSGLPPAFVLTAEYDFLRDQGEHYAERLSSAGVITRTKRYLGTFHGFFELDGGLQHSTAAIDDIGHFIREFVVNRAI
jgi:acetyl esterase